MLCAATGHTLMTIIFAALCPVGFHRAAFLFKLAVLSARPVAVHNKFCNSHYAYTLLLKYPLQQLLRIRHRCGNLINIRRGENLRQLLNRDFTD